ncbi:MAG: type II secretion system protein [Vulcanimicrobiota bacterium]
MRHQRGMTLTELIIYMALAVLACVLLWSFQKITFGTRQASAATYLVNGETETCINWIRQDVNETALASIQLYPSEGSPSEAPGMALVSNRAYSEELRGKPLVNNWGAPRWDKHVLYTLDIPSGAQTGQLVRWEREIAPKNLLPVLAEVLPSTFTDRSRVVLRDVLAPHTTVEKVGREGRIETDEFGGFRSQFVRRVGGSGGEEVLTTVNPTAGNPRDNTRLLEFELKILEDGKNYYSVSFRSAARH